MTENKKLYEFAYFLSSSISEDDVLKHVQELRDILEKHSGEIVREELPQIRNLAYPIKHQRQGYFGYTHFKTSNDQIKDLNITLQLSKDILRFFIIEVSKKQLEQLAGGNINIPKKQQKEAEKAVESVLKRGAKSQVEEQKVEFEELEEKLEEILNK